MATVTDLTIALRKSDVILDESVAYPSEQQDRGEDVQFDGGAQEEAVRESDDEAETLPHAVVGKGGF